MFQVCYIPDVAGKDKIGIYSKFTPQSVSLTRWIPDSWEDRERELGRTLEYVGDHTLGIHLKMLK